MDVPSIDRSISAYLDEFEALAGRNSQAKFEGMEWE